MNVHRSVAPAGSRGAWTFLAIAILGTACSSRHPAEKKAPAECQQYEAALDRCFHRDSGFASQPALVPSSDADRVRIGKTCAENLERLPASCR